MVRNVLAVMGGLVLGMALNMALIQFNMNVLFPMPEDLDMNDTEKLNAFLAGLPAMAFILVMVAHVGQSFVGGWFAARFGASRPMLLAMIIGVFSLAGGIAATMMITGPPWMVIELPLYLIVAWLAGRLEQNRRAHP